MDEREHFGAKLRKVRLDRGLTQQELATAINSKQRTVSRWESGEREPGWGAMQRLVRFFGVSYSEFEMEDGATLPKKSPRGRPWKKLAWLVGHSSPKSS